MKTTILIIVCLLFAPFLLNSCNDISWGDSNETTSWPSENNDVIESALVGVVILVDGEYVEIETDDGLTLDTTIPESETILVGDTVAVILVFEGDEAKNNWSLTDVVFDQKIN